MSAVPSRPVRWKTGLALLVLSPVVVLGAWYIGAAVSDRDRTQMMIWGIAALALCFLVQLIWWLFFARLTWKGRLLGTLLVLLAAGAVAGCIRIEGYTGEMLPIFAWRFSPTPEQQAADYFNNHAAAPASSEVPVTGSAPETSDAVAPAVTPDDWPQFRGSGRDGVESDASIRTDWDARPLTAVWKHPIGRGWSGFAVVGELLFTQEQRGDQELVVCYAAPSGVEQWTHADPVRFSEALGGDGPRATPTYAEGRLYTLGATGVLNCLDPLTGKLLWQHDILSDAGAGQPVDNIVWGMAGSPAVYEGKVYVAPGGRKGRGVIAYDAATGEMLWTASDAPASYAAPRIETLAGVPQLLVFHGLGLSAFNPQTGAELWSFDWTNGPLVNASQPIVRGDQVFISSGYGSGSALLDVAQTDDGWKVAEAWRNDNAFKLKFNDGVLSPEGTLYGLDEGILACYDFATGKRHWKNGRYGYGQVVLLGDTLVVLAEDGRLVAVKATAERFEELASFQALEGKTWNHIAYSRGFLYVRNDREAACYDVRPAKQTAAAPTP